MKRIIYKDDVRHPETGEISENATCLVNPTAEINTQAEAIKLGENVVPAGLPFWIVENGNFPTTKAERDAMVNDQNIRDPDGVGGG